MVRFGAAVSAASAVVAAAVVAFVARVARFGLAAGVFGNEVLILRLAVDFSKIGILADDLSRTVKAQLSATPVR